MTGPEGYVPSALSNPVPEFSLRYHLDGRDALAWETLPAVLRGRKKAIYIGFLVAGGMAYGIFGERLPPWAVQIPYILQMLVVVAVMHGLWMAYFGLLRRHRGRKRLPRRISCVFEDWGDHIYVHNELEEVSLSADLCRQTVVTANHVFLDFGDPLVIVPVASFESPAQAANFIGKWRRLCEQTED